ncbi:MAG: hypothetical protein MUC49_16065 [Raineya sp.]|jgi:hypothetical protein|nr:hypothetical protein [Raineya sp.]
MKNVTFKTLLIIVLFFVSLTSKAQDENYQTIFGKNSQGLQISGFGNLITELSISTSSPRIGTFYSVGAEGAILFNQKFYIGAYGVSSVAPLDITKSSANLTTNELMFVQTGLSVGYKAQPMKAIHMTFGLRTGYGHLQEFSRSYSHWDDYTFYESYTPMFVATPHISVEANFFPWMKASLGLGYRQVFGKDDGLGVNPVKDLSQPIIQTGLSFGWFKPKKRKAYTEQP